MSRPVKHPKTGTYLIRKAIPSELQEAAKRVYGVSAEFRINLKTKDPTEAKRRAPAALAEMEGKFVRVRAEAGRPRREPSEKAMAALAGLHYAEQLGSYEDAPGGPEGWDAVLDGLSDQIAGCGDEDRPEVVVQPSKAIQATAEKLLAEHGFAADPATVARLAEEVFWAETKFAKGMKKRAGGDWSPDPNLPKFPRLDEALSTQTSPLVQFDNLLAAFALDKGWGAVDAKPISRPLYDRKRTLARLADFLGHSNAARVTKADASRWKEDMQKRGLKPPTVRNDLSECSAVWKWAIRNGKLAEGVTNPFEGLLPPKETTRKMRKVRRPFTQEEAKTVLEAARVEVGVLRWLPWVCALTGARLNEICQSVKEDVGVVDGVSVLRIHDEGEGRSVKNDASVRTVPLHPALVDEGFQEYVAALPTGSPLFPDVEPDGVFGQRAPTAGRRVSRWLKGLGITDPAISPNHSWRHFFIDACRRVSMPEEVRSALTGHAGKADESAGYGEGVGSMVALMAEHLAKVKPPVGAAAKSARDPERSRAPSQD